ncbi:MAG: regulator [Cuniculiplasma sp.]
MEPEAGSMWDIIQEAFGKYHSQMSVVKYLINYGFSVKEKYDNEYGIFCGSVEVRSNSLALSVGVDKRVVIQVVSKIVGDKTLFEFFSKLTAIADMSSAVSKLMNLVVLEIIPEDASKPGIISDALKIIADSGVGIRQVIVQDPVMVDEPRARIVTDSPLNPEVISKIRNIPNIKGLTIL